MKSIFAVCFYVSNSQYLSIGMGYKTSCTKYEPTVQYIIQTKEGPLK